jgi:hypothetical protein
VIISWKNVFESNFIESDEVKVLRYPAWLCKSLMISIWPDYYIDHKSNAGNRARQV